MLEKMFKLKENNTTVKTEVLARITTFMTMAYILAVNPSMLAAAGMDKTAVLMATCIASFIGTLAMAMLANYPFALAPGMGLNGMWRNGIRLENRPYGGFCRRSDFYRALPYQCA